MLHKRRNPGGYLFWGVWFLAVLALLLSGAAYRVMASRLKLITGTQVKLPVALSNFPLEVGGWVGRDVPISETVQRVAGNDDFVNRLYVKEMEELWANVYIAYSARPRNMLGHRPQVCYVGGGWVHDGTQKSEFTTNLGRRVPCLVHRFHRPAPETEEIVVLNFYVVNGQFTNDESVFSGLGWRTPNIGGNPARYVAQVQIGSALIRTARSELWSFIPLQAAL